MKKPLLAVLFLLTASLYACRPHGKRITITDQLEVYIKGEATEEEGRLLGEYIATLDSSNKNEKSIQLTKDSSLYTVRMVVPQENLADKELQPAFEALFFLVKENVFPGEKVRMILTDEEFKDKREVAEMADLPLQDDSLSPAPGSTGGE